MSASSTVYDRVPLLERDWAGLSVSRARLLAASEQWYWRRLDSIQGPVCELGCGYGRLLLRLARSGVLVHGCDVSESRIRAAESFFRDERLPNCTFEVRSMPEVPDRRGFHAVILALNAIGYVVDEADKRRLLGNIAGILKPGGLLLMDHARGSTLLRVLRRWPGLRGKVGADGSRLKSHLHWDGRKDCICETFILHDSRGQTIESLDYFRFTSVRRTLTLLSDAGFQVEELCGSFAGTRYRPWSRMVALVARLGKSSGG